MPPSTKDNYPAAALRHFHDAEILRSANSCENALCHYAFSVECSQKALLYWSKHLSKTHHNISTDWENVSPLLTAWALLDGGLAATLPSTSLPPRLYNEHPSRRYHRCYFVTQEELAECQDFAYKMERVIINMMIDGLITDTGGYVP